MKTGVLVMAYGTPSTPEDVEAYYTRIRHGRAPTPELLADLQRRYNAIGGTSPLAQRSAAQVAGLAAALEEQAPGEFDVRFGSKYEPPLLEAAAESFRDDGFTHVVGLVLAPHSSSMSTDQYMDRARAALLSLIHIFDATPMAVALAWLLQRSPNILLIPGTSSVAHLRENVAGAGLNLSEDDVRELETIGN